MNEPLNKTSLPCPGPVPAVSVVAARVDAATADPVPTTQQPANSAACEKLDEDAAQTTLMVVEFQRWYREQARAFGKVID